jgi:AcrR family transcriptional regulator
MELSQAPTLIRVKPDPAIAQSAPLPCMQRDPRPMLATRMNRGNQMTDQSQISPEPKPDPEAGRTEPLTRQDWLDLALRTLVEDGIDRVKVQIMAKKLGVARSSFYWHFASQEDLHKAMLDDWLRKNTSPIIERSMRPEPDVNRAIISVFECWIDEALFNPELDIAVRLWGRRAPSVRAVVMEADALRLDALRRMFLRYGFPEKEAMIRARVIYFTQIGQYTLDVFEEPEVRFSHGPAYIHIFTGVAPDDRQRQELADRVAEHIGAEGTRLLK